MSVAANFAALRKFCSDAKNSIFAAKIRCKNSLQKVAAKTTRSQMPPAVPAVIDPQTIAEFVAFASPLIGQTALSYSRYRSTWNRFFRAHFGLGLLLCIDLWQIVGKKITSTKLQKTHFFWGLYHLKNYPTGATAASFFSTTETNWREKVNRVVRCFAQMDLVFLVLRPRPKLISPSIEKKIDLLRGSKNSVAMHEPLVLC